MRIYTRSGDEGWTGLYGGGRTAKTSARIRAIGEVDELNSALGLASVALGSGESNDRVQRIQSRLFDLGAELASPPDGLYHQESVHDADVAELEREIDGWDGELTPLRTFILPGGTEASARLHLARSICRRAERAVLDLHGESPLRADVLTFLNRLSDWLFTLARVANARAGMPDVPWAKREP